MSSKPSRTIELSDSLHLAEYPPTSGHCGVWLYDETRGMNLAMRAPNERAAFVEALTYYQERLAEVEKEHARLTAAVSAFVETVRPSDDDEGDAP